MSETGYSDKTATERLRFSYVPAEAFDQMPPGWRKLKFKELAVVESIWDSKRPNACLEKAKEWAASYLDFTDLGVVPAPLELADSLHRLLVRGSPSPDSEALMRLAAILQGIYDRFQPPALLAALDRDLRLCKACGPVAIFVNSELEIVSANGLALNHFDGKRSAFARLARALQNEIAHGVEDRTYVSFRHNDGNGEKWDATIVPWQGSLRGVMLSLERPRQLRRDDIEPAIRFLESCAESLRSVFEYWHRDPDPVQIGPPLEALHRRLRSEYYAEVITGLARSAGPEFSTDLNYHAAHVLLRGLGNAFVPYTPSPSVYSKEHEHLSGLIEKAPSAFSWSLRLVQLVMDLFESLACEANLERSQFTAATAVMDAFDRFKALDLTGAIAFKLEAGSSGADERELAGDARLIGRACFGILYEMLYHRPSGSVTVGYIPDVIEGRPAVRIEFEDHPEHHDALHTAGFTGLMVAEKIVRAHGGRMRISASRTDENPDPRRISLWIPEAH